MIVVAGDVQYVVGTDEIWEYASVSRSSNLLLGTFLSKETQPYANYIQGYNVKFFERSNSSVRVFTEETGHNYYPKDLRWNKIKIVAELIERTLNDDSSHRFDYFIFFDADLLFLDNAPADFLLQTIREHSEADIIMSEDLYDFANSGLMITKVSSWSLRFFQRWWALSSGHAFCDQHVLNLLSLHLENEQSLHRVATVPFGVLNSQWPALEHYQSDHNVLHLLGEYNEVREAIGRYMLADRQKANGHPSATLPQRLQQVKLEALKTMYSLALQEKKYDVAASIVQHVCSMQLRLDLKHENRSLLPDVDCESYYLIPLQGQLQLIISNFSSSLDDLIEAKELSLHLYELSLLMAPASLINEQSLDFSLTELPSVDDLASTSNWKDFVQFYLALVDDLKSYPEQSSDAEATYHIRRAKFFDLVGRKYFDAWQMKKLSLNVHSSASYLRQALHFNALSINESQMALSTVRGLNSSYFDSDLEGNLLLEHVSLQHRKVLWRLDHQADMNYYIDESEKENMLDNTSAICDDISNDVEALQDKYRGELRLLISVVKDALTTCGEKVYQLRRPTRGKARSLRSFVQQMKYFGQRHN